MAYEQRDNSGTLFKNDKRTTDRHPHAKGKAMIGGVMYWVSAWTKEGEAGKFQSLSFQPMENQPAQHAPAKAAPRQADPIADKIKEDCDGTEVAPDDIPF